MNKLIERLKNGIITENPLFVQVLATCPTLAVSTSVKNAIGMGIAATVVLIFSNIFISALRKFIPEKVRIPAYIVIIAGFVTMIDLLMQAYFVDLYASLGIFIPLIVVNCIILGRAESYAGKNPVIPSAFDGLGQGLGFTLALILIAAIREILGNGTFFDITVLPSKIFTPMTIMILAPGAFLTFGLLAALINKINIKKGKKTLDIRDCSKCGLNCHRPNGSTIEIIKGGK